jgi:hypothetical protein
VLSYLQRFKVLSTGASSSLGNSTRAKGASGHATGSSDDDSSGGSDAEVCELHGCYRNGVGSRWLSRGRALNQVVPRACLTLKVLLSLVSA